MASTTTAGLDETFDALTHPYRRHVLYYMQANSGETTIDTLTEMLTNELEGPSATAERETSEQIEVALHHTHLPKLAEVGLITFAQDGQSVESNGMNGHGQFIDDAARIDGYAPPAAGD